MTFEPHASNVIVLSYRIAPGGGADGNHIYRDTVYRARPAGYSWKGATFTWQMEDWEPREDFRLSLDWHEE